MDALLREQQKTAATVNLQKSLDDVDTIVGLLEDAQSQVASSQSARPSITSYPNLTRSGIRCFDTRKASESCEVFD
jgi:hypothetical protein